ncbi:hypothetical protein L484_014339 [Morus notabilis]|uniref:Uncharacterized protein n=1 Tax=Morus notabilis TaxID=981085 RepID=W9RTM7_9ROSA|nr:hypothetical protein L484_014339 [Morus notabilis]
MTPSRRSTLIALPTPPRRRLKSSAFFGVRNRVQHRLGQRLLHPDCPVWLRVRAVLRLLASASPLHLLLLVNRFAPKDSGFRLYLIRNLICKDKEQADSWILGFESHNIKVSPS